MGPYQIEQLDPELQQIAVDNFTFQNWAKTFKCTPELLFTPVTESQVQKVKKIVTLIFFVYFFDIFFSF